MLPGYTKLKDTFPRQWILALSLPSALWNHSRSCCGLDELTLSQIVPGHASGIRMAKRSLTDLLAEEMLNAIFTDRLVPVCFDFGVGEHASLSCQQEFMLRGLTEE